MGETAIPRRKKVIIAALLMILLLIILSFFLHYQLYHLEPGEFFDPPGWNGARVMNRLQNSILCICQYYIKKGELPPRDKSLYDIFAATEDEGVDMNSVNYLTDEEKKRKQILDCLGNPYKIKYTGDSIIVYSFGPNGTDDDCKKDDIYIRIEIKGKIDHQFIMQLKRNCRFKNFDSEEEEKLYE